MRTETINIYTIDEHPNPSACFDWIRENWYDMNEHSADEVCESVKALADYLGTTVDYRISQVPDRGERISFGSFSRKRLEKLDPNEYPLTGVCWDADLIEGLLNDDPEAVLRSLHDDTEYIYSDEGLREMCEGNEYEFLEDGSVV